MKRSYSHVFSLVVLALYLFAVARFILDPENLPANLAGRRKRLLGGAYHDITGSYSQIMILGTLGLALTLWMVIDEWRKAALFDARRQAVSGIGAALSLSKIRLAEPAALTLPMTIRLQVAWRCRRWRIIIIVLVALAQIFILLETLMLQPLPWEWPMPLIVLASDAGLGGFMLLLLALNAVLSRERLVVTDEGLRAAHFATPQLVRWEEARLFARVYAEKFELSSPHGVMRFSYVKDAETLRPRMPFPQYRSEASALLSPIGERTGLLLIDPRETP